MSFATDGLYIPDGYRRPRKGEDADVLVCQCYRRVLVPVEERGEHHRCAWVPLVFARDNPFNKAE